MKKYKSELTFNQIFSKYRLVYFFTYAFGFLILSIILGVVLYVVLSTTFYSGAKSDIDDYLLQYQFNEGMNRDVPEIPTGEFRFPKIIERDMTAVIFYTDENGVLDNDYEVVGADFNEDYKNAIIEDFYIELEEDDFIITVVDNGYYLTKLVKIENASYYRENLQGFVKAYKSIDAEVGLRSRIVSLYSLVALVTFVISFGFGFIVMKESTKPLSMFITKQTNFVSDASHELRTPLAVVQSKIETILSQPDKNVCDVSEDLAIALKEISRLTKLTQELLTLARNDKDNIDMNYTIFNINDELKNIVEPFIEIAEISGKTLAYEGSDCMVKLDKDKLKQIMIINIDNALKYTEEGGKININTRTLKDEFQIQIADDGIGLSDEAKSKIFDRFYRADKARSRETGGNGLGLSIAHTLIHLQKGTINVYDNQPKGTRFVITFPKAKEKETSQALLENKNE